MRDLRGKEHALLGLHSQLDFRGILQDEKGGDCA